MTVYKKIDEGLVYPSDFFDVLAMCGLNFPLDTEADVRAHIGEIRNALDAEGDTYTQTNEEIIQEILEIKERVYNGDDTGN
jgi:hypothetical protein